MSEWKQGAADRRDERATKSDGAPRHRSNKTTKKWCKGKPGREHIPSLEVHGTWGCHDDSWWPCSHREVCTGCGKVLRWRLDKDECPTLRGTR